MTETQKKIQQHKELWAGRGPCLLLIPTEKLSLYDTDGYKRRFDDPQLMWEAEMRRTSHPAAHSFPRIARRVRAHAGPLA